MKMNMGRDNSGYHFISLIVALKGIIVPPSPQRKRAAKAPTNPMAPNTLCPVRSISIMVENMRRAIIS
jgi:hypothetical protein